MSHAAFLHMLATKDGFFWNARTEDDASSCAAPVGRSQVEERRDRGPSQATRLMSFVLRGKNVYFKLCAVFTRKEAAIRIWQKRKVLDRLSRDYNSGSSATSAYILIPSACSPSRSLCEGFAVSCSQAHTVSSRRCGSRRPHPEVIYHQSGPALRTLARIKNPLASPKFP